MKTFFLLLLQCFVGAFIAHADEPLYVVRLKSNKAFELGVGGNSLSFYPFSSMMTKVNERFVRRKIVGADALTGMQLLTTEPKIAIQEVLRQISEQTGLSLGAYHNTAMAKIAPVTFLQGFSETAVITLLLTPDGKDTYTLTCSYVIDARPEGSIDGTPAGIAKLEAMRGRMTADSIATVLPEKFKKAELKSDDYFFPGPMQLLISDVAGEKQTPVLSLHIKKGDRFSLGIYQERDGVYVIIDQPIDLTGYGYAGIFGRNKGTSLRSGKKGGGGGIDFFVENGHVVRKPYTE